MKNFLLLSVFALLSSFAFAQDVIIKLSGEEVPAKVEESPSRKSSTSTLTPSRGLPCGWLRRKCS